MAGFWKIQGEEKAKFDSIFDSLGAVAGKLSGDKVKPILLNSKLPTEMLGHVWELSDIDKDGFLDREEFSLAMHLVYKALDHDPVPSSLPPDLVPPSKRRMFMDDNNTGLPNIMNSESIALATNSSLTLPAIGADSHSDSGLSRDLITGTYLDNSSTGVPNVTSTASSARTTGSSLILPAIGAKSPPGSGLGRDIITDKEYNRFCTIFAQNVGAETHIAGPVARDIFMKSGLPQSILAHVWNLCDQEQLGRLTKDQFILAMHYINQKVKGIELPSELPPDVLPVPVRLKNTGFANSGDISDSSSGVGDISAVRELDSLHKEIEELRKEKETLTVEIREKGTIVNYRSNKIQDLQSTLDHASTSLAQLESDKAECHTRLDELDQQQLKLDGMLTDIRVKVQEETHTISALQSKIKEQEMYISRQEAEFSKIKSKLDCLKKEEMQLQQTLEIGQRRLHSISKQVTDAGDEIAKVQEQIEALTEKQKNVHSNIAQYDKAVMALKNEAEEPSNLFLSNNKKDGSFDTSNSLTVKQSVCFTKDPFSNEGRLEEYLFAEDDLFAVGSHLKTTGGVPSDPFAPSEKVAKDPFSNDHDPFGSADKEFHETGFDSDPFGGSDPFSRVATCTSSKARDELVKKASDMFSSRFFDQDNSESLFGDGEHVSDLQRRNEGSNGDPWGSCVQGTRVLGESKEADSFGKAYFEPGMEPSEFHSFQDQFSPTNKINVISNGMSKGKQLPWAAESHEQAKEDR